MSARAGARLAGVRRRVPLFLALFGELDIHHSLRKMGLFDEEGSEDGGGLFGPPQPAGPPAATMVCAPPLSVTPGLSRACPAR